MNMSYPNTATLDTIVEHYLGCALWCSSVEQPYADAHDMPEDTSMESAGFSISDLHPSALDMARTDCEDFLTEAADLIAESGLSAEQIGHDFWLTRNHHGAGFWDRGLGVVGAALTEMAHPHGECNLYVGDDEQIYSM